MFAKLLKPQIDLACLVLRLGLAAIFIVHGVLKIDQNFPLMEEWTMDTQMLLGWTELVCGTALAVGLLSRLAAAVLIGMQLGAIWLFTGKYAMQGLLITKSGADYTRVGPEYNLVLIAMGVGVILLGSGAVSVDHFLLKLWRRRKSPTAAQTVPGANGSATPAVTGTAVGSP